MSLRTLLGFIKRVLEVKGEKENKTAMSPKRGPLFP
jgi:hypothetical protein